jgi:hypothetical protein
MKKTQLQQIIDILENEGSIDNFRAMNTRLTLRLAMHIHLLRSKGYEIETKELPDKNTVYTLITKPAPQIA